MEPWMSPLDRYYYPWYGPEPGMGPPLRRSDREIKSDVVAKLRQNPYTKEHTLRVDVKGGVVVLQGIVPNRLSKRSAGDDCWDVEGVADVSNQLQVSDTAADDRPIEEVMSRSVISVPSDASIEEAAGLMREHGIGFLVVLDADGGLEGVVTDRDLVVRGLAGGGSRRVGDVATSDVVTAPVSSRPGDLTAMMVWSSIRRLPVVDDDGSVLGIVSLGDLARHVDPGSALASISAAPTST